MLIQELPIGCAERIVQMIPDVVCVHFLFGGVERGIAVDDDVPGGLFRENFGIDVGNVFQKNHRRNR